MSDRRRNRHPPFAIDRPHHLAEGTPMSEHIVAVFETEADATNARRSLESLGISAAAIRQYAGSEQSARATPAAETTTTHSSGGGFWAWLFGDEETTSESYRDDLYDRRTAAGN